MFELEGKYTKAKVMIDNLEQECISQIYTFLSHPAFTNPVAIMPDSHAGRGSVIGFCMTLTDKVIPAVVGVDIGCFTGNTKVPLLNGTQKTFLELYKNNKKFWVYSIGKELKIVPGKARCVKTRKNANLVKVTISGGDEIVCTPDQKFMLKNGKYKKADDLKANDSLMPLYRIYQTRDGYESITNAIHGSMPTHEIVCDYCYGKIPKGHVRHHKDRNNLNNDPENLEVLAANAHSRLHRKKDKSTERFRSEKFKRNRKRMLKKNGFYAKHLYEIKKQTAIKNLAPYLVSKEFKENCKKNGKRGSKYLTKYNKSKKGIEKSKEISNRIITCEICGDKIKSYIGLYNHKKKEHSNHKVISVEKIKRTEDVYCLQVDKYHNFALSAGVFVHNCGMKSVNIGKTIPISFTELDQKIRAAIPFGMNVHERGLIHMEKEFPWESVTSLARNFVTAYNQKFNTSFHAPLYNMKWFEELCERTGTSLARAINSIGSLGSGNHFVEIGQSTNGNYWVTIHTGSRNLGSRVCEYWQNLACKNRESQNRNKMKEQIQEIKKTHKGKEIKEEIKKLQNYTDVPATKDLQFLTDQDAMGYLLDTIFCSKYAEVNRRYIMGKITDILKVQAFDIIETVHNFIDYRDFVIRKGAIRSYVGECMIIPFNMRDGILICEGKSNPEWNFSAPHGAGRVMSRSKAKQTVDLAEFQESMKGIFSTSIGHGTLDESPMVYKDAKIIEQAIEPTAKIIDKIKPVMNMKDGQGERD